MKIQAYRKKFSPTIETPGGLKVQIRPLRVEDFLSVGNVPDVLAISKDGTPGDNAKVKPKVDPEQYKRLSRSILLNCVTILDEETEIKVVEGPAANELEFSFTEFAPIDVAYLIKEVSELSGMTQGAATVAAPFPA